MLLGMLAVLLAAVIAHLNIRETADYSIQLHLKFIGSSIYQYHSLTGHWPHRVEELAITSLPLQSPYWKVMIDAGTNVVVWRDDLNPDPLQNAHFVLAFHNKGLLAWMGRRWVCWGDLRTEYIPNRKLREALQGARGMTAAAP